MSDDMGRGATGLRIGRERISVSGYSVHDIGCGATYSLNGGPGVTVTCGHRLVWAGYHHDWCPSFGSPPKPKGLSVDEWVFAAETKK